MRIEAPAAALLRIDLDALAGNYRLLKATAAPAECAAVVKADAYGLGMVGIARRLLREGCRKFFVATLAEVAELRALAPDVSIYVLEGAVLAAVDELVALRATPVLSSLDQIERWRGHGRALLHIDTGMTRLGLSAADVRVLAGRPELLQGIELEYVITHLACADEPEHPQNRAQVRLFDELRRLLPPAKTSIGNSAATFIDAAHRGDLVRPGVALYGGNPFAGRPNPMQPVVTWLAPILQIREIEAAVPVGYGATYVAKPPARLAVVGTGYADGYPRSLGNRATAALHGLRVPVVGRVSMDLICVDVSALPRDSVRVGDFVELIGPTVGVDEVAAAAGTISYEILTGLGKRLIRQYVEREKA
ncbi:MAG TPA: alanine racemase [Gammaproteobacteria bacterium]|jgi:alanine racemase|nr:alanine racemase [Gammaproteobacteria bacterium]